MAPKKDSSSNNEDDKGGGLYNKVSRFGSRVWGSLKWKSATKTTPTTTNTTTTTLEDDAKVVARFFFKRARRMEEKKQLQQQYVAQDKKVGATIGDGMPKKSHPKEQQRSEQTKKEVSSRRRRLDSEAAVSAALSRKHGNIAAEDRDVVNVEDVDQFAIRFTDAFDFIEDSLLTIRTKLNRVRVPAVRDAETGTVLTPEEEFDRLNQLRSQLELRKQNLLVEAQKRKKEMEETATIKREQQRIASETAKKKTEERRLEKVKAKERMERQKAVRRALSTKDESSGSVGPPTQEVEVDSNTANSTETSTMGEAFGKAQTIVTGVWDSVFKKKNEEDVEKWIPVCLKTMIAPGEVVPVVAGGLDLLIVASKDGKRVNCIANSCPHLGTPLESGRLESRPIEWNRGGAGSKKSIEEQAPAINPKTGDALPPKKEPGGLEDCIVCPLHHTAFALESGEVRGKWCPYPPVIGSIMGAMKPEAKLPTFSIRIRGKNIEVRINTSLEDIELKTTQS